MLAIPGKLTAPLSSLPPETTPIPEATSGTEPSSPPMESLGPSHRSGSMLRKPLQGTPSEQVPLYDPVRTIRFDARATKCRFVGRLPRAPAQLIASGVTRAECPECGALRTLGTQGSRLLFPSHAERLLRRARQDIRWVRRGSTWELFSPTPHASTYAIFYASEKYLRGIRFGVDQIDRDIAGRRVTIPLKT